MLLMIKELLSILTVIDLISKMRAYQIKDGFWQFVQDRDNEVKDHLKLLRESVNA